MTDTVYKDKIGINDLAFGSGTFNRRTSSGGVKAITRLGTIWEDLLADTSAADVLTALGITAYAQTILDDPDASTAQSTLGISDFVKTILNDANAAAVMTTLGITGFAQTILDDADAATARATLGVPATGDTQDADDFPGLVIRPKFTWKDADEIYISAGVYHHEGTTEQFVYWNSELTFQAGSGGSNSDSTNLGNSERHYVYIDDSAVVTAGTNLLTEAEFLNSTTAPTWTEASHAWMNGDDRCIFGFTTDGSGNIIEFFHDGDLVMLADSIEDQAAVDIDTTWTDVTLSTAPAFTRRVLVSGISAGQNAKWRTNGQTQDEGHGLSDVGTDDQEFKPLVEVVTDSSQIIECQLAASDASTLAVYTHGWHLPHGM